MIKEQEEAIEILEKFKNNEMQRDKLERDNRCSGWKIGDIYKHLELNKAIETILNMLKEKDKEIEFQKDINKIEKDRHKKTEKSLKGQISKKDKMINDAISFINDNCLEKIADMKGCYREIASVGDLQELTNILKGR